MLVRSCKNVLKLTDPSRYWDWALNEATSRIPAVLQQTSITVVKPGSGSTQIPNPLYHYRFLGPQPQDLFEATTVRSSDANDILAASLQR